MRQYNTLVHRILIEGHWHENRTGHRTKRVIGHHLHFENVAVNFPIVTTKKLAWRSCFAEMLGFWRGYESAADFRKLGCNVWNANANENKAWLENKRRKGEDDLGRIYGVQWRSWKNLVGINKADNNAPVWKITDQLHSVYNRILQGDDDRRLIVTAWNPHELRMMALPPCHVLFQFSINHDFLELSMYQRSADVALSVPFNISGYAWMLCTMAHITGLKAGDLNIYIHDAHIYERHMTELEKQTMRQPHILPILKISKDIRTMEDMDNTAEVTDFELINYIHEPAIKYEMAV